MINLNNIATEQSNARTTSIDSLSTLAMVQLINSEDQKVALAVEKITPAIAQAIDLVTEALRNNGRLIYLGSGTSGRLGILDAVECPPTYNTDPELVQGIIAGGTPAIFRAQEGAEDNRAMGAQDLRTINLTKNDVLIGVTASGRTPYVLGGLEYAKELGATTISVVCSANAPTEEYSQITLCAEPGPEVITGSTRMKAGTAQKLILNMLSTGAMIKLGKVYKNLMVDVKTSNQKLEERAKRIVMEATGCDRATAITTLEQAQGSAKTAILMLLAQLTAQEAQVLLAQSQGNISTALQGVQHE